MPLPGVAVGSVEVEWLWRRDPGEAINGSLAPSSGSSLGFGGCHVPVHIIGLPVLVWASCQGKRCFPQG